MPAVAMALSLVGNHTLESKEQALHSKRLVNEAIDTPNEHKPKGVGI